MPRAESNPVRSAWLAGASLLGSALALAAATNTLLTPRTSHWLLVATGTWLAGGLVALLLFTNRPHRRAAVTDYALGGALNAVDLGSLYLELGLQRGFDAGDGTLWSQLAWRILHLRWEVAFHLGDVGWWTSLLLFVTAPWIAVALVVVPAQTRTWRIVLRTSVLAAGTWFVLETPALHDGSIACLVEDQCAHDWTRAQLVVFLCVWFPLGWQLVRRFSQSERGRLAVTGYLVGSALSILTIAPRMLWHLTRSDAEWLVEHGLGWDAVLAVAGYLLLPHLAVVAASAMAGAPAASRFGTRRSAAGLFTLVLLIRSVLDLNSALFVESHDVSLFCRADGDCERGGCGGQCASAQPGCEVEMIFQWDSRVRCRCEYARCADFVDLSLPRVLESH